MTYFFASSGGQTESVQNVFRLAPEAWLVGDPTRTTTSLNNPYHRWKMSLSLNAAERQARQTRRGLAGGHQGAPARRLAADRQAQVVGTKGAVTVTGAQLRKSSARRARGVVHDGQRPRRADEHDAGCTTTSDDHHADDRTTTTGATAATGGGGLRDRRGASLALLDHVAEIVGLAIPHRRLRGQRHDLPRRQRHAGDRPVRSRRRLGDGGQPGRSRPVAATRSPSRIPGNYRVLYDGAVGPEITVG